VSRIGKHDPQAAGRSLRCEPEGSKMSATTIRGRQLVRASSTGRWVQLLLSLAVLLAVVAWPSLATAAPTGHDAFLDTWARSDLPVAEGRVDRTWMWGPEPFTVPLREPYVDAPGGTRLVQYFDKSRMEITNPAADRASPWYVTNGLLAKELITGQLQLGDQTFQTHPPAVVNVAGDPDDPAAPTYATFAALLAAPPLPVGSAVTQTLDRAGQVGNDPALARYGVTAALLVPETGHSVASVFWTFMNSRGTVYTGWRFREDALFPNPFYATGFPITEPYWTRVRVGGTPRDVLVQCFERRCLTYTPDNPPGWQVEAGNVGQHYYRWRYEQLGQPVQEAGVYQLATVTNVVDGDTIDVRFTDGRTARVRLIGVDTPEVYGQVECFGVAASQFTAEWLAGKEVALQRDVSETDRYGRLLRSVWIGPYLFNEVLVRRGYAGVATDPPDVAYAGRFVEAERAAREERAGLWGVCPVPPVGRDTEPAPPPGPAPSPSPTPTPAPNCDPSYPTVCIPPPPPDLDCADIPYRRFPVLPPDPHRFDPDRDGIGCESG
jgi:endonuclease YncB( thermonuclease family)